MPAVALKDGNSIVTCTDGVRGSVCQYDSEGNPIKWHWDSGTTFVSDTGTTDVTVEGIGVVCVDDTMQSHPWGDPCVPSPVMHAPAVTEADIQGDPKVFIGGKLVARIGDKYNSESFDHTISTGASTVFIG